MEALAQREETERAERAQARLQTEAEGHARAASERDRYLRELAALTAVMAVPGTGALPQAQAAACAPCFPAVSARKCHPIYANLLRSPAL